MVFKNNRVLHLVEAEEGSFSISCRFRNCDDNLLWCFVGVFGPIAKKEREGFWTELGAIRGLWNDPWCVVGDLWLLMYNSLRKENYSKILRDTEDWLGN